MHRFLLIPLFVALIFSQGMNRSVSVCFSELGQCTGMADVVPEDACPCAHGEPQPQSSCEEDCAACHLDHADEVFVFSGASLDRPQLAVIYTPHVIYVLEPLLAQPEQYSFSKSADPPRPSVEEMYRVRLL